MKAETYKTLLAMDRQDPMTEMQRKALLGEGNDDETLSIQQVSELTGLAVNTIRQKKRELPPVGYTRLLRYRKRDVMAFMATPR